MNEEKIEELKQEQEKKKKKKRTIIITSIIILIIITIILICIFTPKKKEIAYDIKFMHFYYSTGTAMNDSVSYDLTCNEGCNINIKPSGIPNEKMLKTSLDDKTVKDIAKILEDNNVVEWDGFNKFDKYVLDGNGFSFSLENKNGEKVSADGYMKWPKNYTTVKSKLDKIFNKIYKEKSS